MADILLISQNSDFSNDLQNQISRYAPDFCFNKETPDVVIIDDDLNEYQKVRKDNPTVPVILISSEVGADEDKLNIILKKPFSLMRLLDILRAANNKLDSSVDGYLIFNNYELHPNKREIVDLLSKNVVKLTEKEVGIIKYLYKNSDKFVNKIDLQKDVWQYNDEVTTHTIETHIYRLRQKVEQNSEHNLIVTENGGYKLQMD